MEGEREEEKHQCVVAFHAPPTGDLAHSPGMCPDWELNQHHFGLQAHASSTELHQPGQICIKFCGKLEHSSVETIWMIQKAGAGDWQPHDNIPAHASHVLQFFGKTSNHPGDSATTAQIWYPAASGFSQN